MDDTYQVSRTPLPFLLLAELAGLDHGPARTQLAGVVTATDHTYPVLVRIILLSIELPSLSAQDSQ